MVVEDIEEEKMALVANKNEEKWEVADGSYYRDIVAEKEYSSPMEEVISLVCKSTGMLETTSRVFVTQTIGLVR